MVVFQGSLHFDEFDFVKGQLSPLPTCAWFSRMFLLGFASVCAILGALAFLAGGLISLRPLTQEVRIIEGAAARTPNPVSRDTPPAIGTPSAGVRSPMRRHPFAVPLVNTTGC